MPVELKSIWGKIKRPWGFEVRIDFEDETKHIHNEVLTFPKEPTDKELNAKIAGLQTRVEDRISDELILAALPVPDPIAEAVVAKEVEIRAMLESKGLLVKGQAIADAKTKTEIIDEAKAGERVEPTVEEAS